MSVINTLLDQGVQLLPGDADSSGEPVLDEIDELGSREVPFDLVVSEDPSGAARLPRVQSSRSERLACDADVVVEEATLYKLWNQSGGVGGIL